MLSSDGRVGRRFGREGRVGREGFPERENLRSRDQLKTFAGLGDQVSMKQLQSGQKERAYFGAA